MWPLLLLLLLHSASAITLAQLAKLGDRAHALAQQFNTTAGEEFLALIVRLDERAEKIEILAVAVIIVLLATCILCAVTLSIVISLHRRLDAKEKSQ